MTDAKPADLNTVRYECGCRDYRKNVVLASDYDALAARLKEVERERDDLKHDIARHMTIANAELNRAEVAEKALAEARQLLGVYRK